MRVPLPLKPSLPILNTVHGHPMHGMVLLPPCLLQWQKAPGLCQKRASRHGRLGWQARQLQLLLRRPLQRQQLHLQQQLLQSHLNTLAQRAAWLQHPPARLRPPTPHLAQKGRVQLRNPPPSPRPTQTHSPTSHGKLRGLAAPAPLALAAAANAADTPATGVCSK